MLALAARWRRIAPGARLGLVAGACALAATAIFLLWWAGDAPPSARLALASDLQTATLVLERVDDEQVFEGVIEAVNRGTVAAQTSGRVVEVLVDVDDYVPAGAVIVRLHDVEQRARLRRAEAAIAEATARAAEAEAEARRIEGIYAQRLIAKSVFDRSVADRDAARARLAAANAAGREARDQVEQTLIRAPYAGIVTERHIEVGEMAVPGKPLMSGLSLERLRVVADVPQRYIEALRAEGRARVLLDGGRSVAAATLRIFPYADPATHSFRVRASLEPQQAGLYPGMLVKVAFASGTALRLLVPASAVVRRGELAAAYVVDADGRIGFRMVVPGAQRGDRVEALAGLAAGERLALDPIAAGIALKSQREAR